MCYFTKKFFKFLVNLNPFINLINNILGFYNLALIIWLIVDLLVRFNILNNFQPVVRYVLNIGFELFDPILRRIRAFLPKFKTIDLAPFILFLLLNFLREFLMTYLYRY